MFLRIDSRKIKLDLLLNGAFLPLIVFALLLLQSEDTNAQEPQTWENHSCGVDHVHERMMQDSSYAADIARNRSDVREVIEEWHEGDNLMGRSAVQYTIPIVVHVIHLGEPEGEGSNISDEQIHEAIDGLNDRYAQAIGQGLDIEMDFCLATVDPNGCPTDGINRVDGSVVPNYAIDGIYSSNDCGASETDLKDLSRWPVLDYYNIWVVHDICGGNIAGYAYYPWGGDNDGTVMKYTSMNYSSRTLAHELGHGFNLPHTFNGDDGGTFCPANSDCLTEGDFICDTPPHVRDDCDVNSCTTEGIWDNSRYNYMSYCYPDIIDYRFTPDQKDRMRASLQVYPRASLLNSDGCSQPLVAIEATNSELCAGGSSDLNVTGQNLQSFLWSTGATSQSITVSPTATTPYSVAVTTNNGCQVDLAYEVVVGGDYTENITVYSCDSYEAPDGQIYSQSGQYTAVVTESSGCEVTYAIDLHVSDTSVPPVSNGDVDACNPGTQTLSVTVPAGTTVDWYSTASGGSPILTDSESYTTDVPGTYYAEVRSDLELEVGDSFGGGVVAYILQPGDPGYSPGIIEGIIATDIDVAVAPWGCEGDLLGVFDQLFGVGKTNSEEIVANCLEPGIAAANCLNLLYGGFTDWHLPSRHELNKLYDNRDEIGGFAISMYWSSSEYEADFALGRGFPGGEFWYSNKSNLRSVRPVRHFEVSNSCENSQRTAVEFTLHDIEDQNIVQSGCDSLVINGVTYAESGQYQQVLTSVAGCDSILNLDLTITGQTDECGECIAGGETDPLWNQSCSDCNGDPNGTAFLDNCGDCVGGNTGETACVADCNGDFGGTAFLDNCGDCVGGNTGETACVADCNGDFGGTAFLDNCGDCVEGNTGEVACEADCNGDFGGSAFLDNCGDCVEGNTGETACTADCNGDFGGTAFLDNCGDCVGGNTGETACVADCNGDFGGSAFLDNCGDCVGGNTGQTACVADCNGDFGGTAFLDNCGDCVEGNTGEEACEADCNGDFGGTAFLDNCGDCVEGNTGETACEADCNGDFGGTAYLDDCEECVGGNTGESPCELCDLELSGSAVAANPGTPDGSASVVVTGGNEPYEYAWNDPLLQATATATGLFTGTYMVTVTDASDCEEQLTVVVPIVSSVPSTQVAGMFCNTSGYHLGNFIAAVGVSGADAYRWEFTDSQNNTLPEYTRTDGNKWVRLEWITDIETGETYDVRVKARVSGTWGEYATVCSIGVSQIVPTTELRPNYTPTNAQGNDYALCDFAIAYNISNSQDFRWRFDGNGTFGDAEDIVYTRGTSNPSVRLNWVNGLVPGLTYNVGVEVQVDGNWSQYGTILPLTLALTPNDVEIRSQFCGGTYSPNGYIMSQSVCEADLYQFRFTPAGGGTPSFRNSGNYVCFMSAANPALTPGEYDVQVKVTQNGVPGDWGPACAITISGPQGSTNETSALRDIEATSSVALFPNPNAGEEVRVNLDGLSDGHHDVMIQVYDVYGKLIINDGFGHEGKSLSRLVRFDGNLTTGMYMVQITVDGKRFATERLIVNQGNGF